MAAAPSPQAASGSRAFVTSDGRSPTSANHRPLFVPTDFKRERRTPEPPGTGPSVRHRDSSSSLDQTSLASQGMPSPTAFAVSSASQLPLATQLAVRRASHSPYAQSSRASSSERGPSSLHASSRSPTPLRTDSLVTASCRMAPAAVGNEHERGKPDAFVADAPASADTARNVSEPSASHQEHSIETPNRMGHDQQGGLRQEAAQVWKQYQARSPFAPRMSGDSLTKSALRAAPSSASTPVSPTRSDDPGTPTYPLDGASEGARTESPTERRSRETFASRLSLNLGSGGFYLGDEDGWKERLLTGNSDPESSSSKLASPRQLQESGRSLSQPSSSTMPVPQTCNELTHDERRQQLRRSQKLVSIFGGELFGEGEDRAAEHDDANRKASRRATALSTTLRRQSDPMETLHTARSQVHKEKISVEPSGFSRARSVLRRRSRSVINIGQIQPASVFPTNPSNTAMSHLSHETRPPNLTSKAAALLGLDVPGTGDREHVGSHRSSGASRTGLKVVPPISYRTLFNVAHSNIPAAPYSAFPRLTNALDGNDLWSAVDSPPTLQADTTSVQSGPKFAPDAIHRDASIDQSNSSSSLEILADHSLELDDFPLGGPREERRKRVAKISKWLGAVVPPHLVSPSLDSHTGPAYMLGDEPHMQEVDYFSGAPTAADSDSESTRSGLNRAKVATLRRLKREPQGSIVPAPGATSFTETEPRTSLLRLSSSSNSSNDHFTNVRRAQTIQKKFGEAPPHGLFGSAPALEKNSSAVSRQSTRRVHGHSASVSAIGRSGVLPGRMADPLQNKVSLPLSTRPRSGSNQYRASLDSLEYLLEHDRHLLTQLVTALDEESESSSSAGLERGAAPALRDPFARPSESRSSSVARTEREYRSPSPGLESDSASLPLSTSDPSDSALAKHPYTMQRAYHPFNTSVAPPVDDAGTSGPLEEVRRGSIASLTSTTDSLETDSVDDTMEHCMHSAHRQQAARAQRIAKFFGEAPPMPLVNSHTAPKPGVADGAEPHGLAGIAMADTGSGGVSMNAHSTALDVPVSARSRLAPRSAGSGTSHAFRRILRSIEDELEDDEALEPRERMDLSCRLEKLRRRQTEIDNA
ncbi:hypothetical protein CBOM_06515 [Ceraceosorus bombacis]|uniref:Uncharacterized protein n=1 Tax=Ceraceosorus bombacis TaxID=401625 RepID=A0A0P1BKH4_9BASI|nr:hypothetical protein CBOM_06515 [Ceraceosorus bombacis]